MRNKLFLTAIVLSLAVLMTPFTALAHVTNNSWYDPQHNPWGLDERAVANMEALLMDMSMRSQNADMRLMTVRTLEVGDGGRLSLESLRDGVLTGLGREHVDRFMTTVFIWVSDEGVLYVSLPEQLQRLISTTLINKIIEDELIFPIWAGVTASDALFNTVSRLGRYIILASETGPQGNQMYVPPAQEHPYVGYHNVFNIPLAPDVSEPANEEPEFQFLTPEAESTPPEKKPNNLLVLGLLLLVVGAGVAVFIIRRRQSEEYYDDEFDEFDDDMFDHDDDLVN